MSRPVAHFVTAAFIVLAAACTTNPVQVRVDQDPVRSVSGYRTFGFYEQPSTDTTSYQTLLSVHLETATRKQLESRGYVFTTENPQLLVNFAVDVRQQQQVQAMPVGAVGLRAAYRGVGNYAVNTVTTRQGTVTIDVVDAANRSIVWQGVGEGAIRPRAEVNIGNAVHGAVTQIFRGFPMQGAL